VLEEAPPTNIPLFELAWHVDDYLDSVWAILLNSLAPTDLSEYGVCGLI